MRPRHFLLLSVLCLGAIGLVAYRSFDFLGCGTESYQVLTSPDGKYKAATFGVDCGATTGFNTQLSILPADASLDRDKYPPVLILDDRWDLNMRWNDGTSLVVAVPKSAHVFKRDSRSGEVTVTYD